MILEFGDVTDVELALNLLKSVRRIDDPSPSVMIIELDLLLARWLYR